MDALVMKLLIIVIGIPFSLLTTLISFLLVEPIRRKFGYFVDVHRNVKRLSMLMKLLEKKRVDLPPNTQGTAREWADGVSSLMQRVDDFQKQYENWRKKASLCSRPWRYGIAQSAGLLLEEVEDLGRVNVDAGRRPPPPAVEVLPLPNNVVCQQRILNEALRYIQDPVERVIGIYGVGGVGKTTLLIQINNYLAHRRDQARSSNAESQTTRDYKFDHVVWATASEDVNLERIQEEIAQHMGLPLPPTSNLLLRAKEVRDYMKEKSFLLLLDNLCAQLELEKLGIPDPREGGSQLRRKVVFTTRFEDVCDSMHATRKIKMGFLNDDDAWALFSGKLGTQFRNSTEDIKKLARDVAKECGGLPLALTDIGVAMSNKSPDEWESALDNLHRSQPIRDMDTVLQTIEKSYNFLKNDRIKMCFLCCALWPKGFSIEEDELMRCWMWIGLLDGYSVHDYYRTGREYIRTLKLRGLLQVDDNEDQKVKIHNVIRVMALQIASREHRWMVLAGVGLQQAPTEVEHWAEVERVSLMSNEITALPVFNGTQGFPRLSTLMVQGNPLNQIPDNFFRWMTNLACLDLSYIHGLTELPGEISYLTGLRYINISETGISSLPKQLGQLENLRCLVLRDSRNLDLSTLNVIPRTLEVLDLYGSSGDWEAVGIDIFRRLESLKVLKMTVRSDQIDRLPSVPLWHIGIEGTDNPAFPNRQLSLPGDHIRNHLRSLSVCMCHNLENVSCVSQLRYLEHLHVYSCNGMTTLISADSERSAFSHLKHLRLEDLRNLECIYNGGLAFPSLETIIVYACPRLVRLPFQWPMTNSRMRWIQGSQGWWNGLQWENNNIKTSIQTYFVPIQTAERIYVLP